MSFEIKPNQKFADIVSNQDLMKHIMSLKSKEEIKSFLIDNGATVTDDEVKMLMITILEIIKNPGKIPDESMLEEIHGGTSRAAFNSGVKFVGQTVSFPFRAVCYAVGAIVAGVPKGFIDGMKDTWEYWED